MGGWGGGQVALVWIRLLEAGVRTVKLGTDIVLRVDDVMPALRLKEKGSVPARGRTRGHPGRCPCRHHPLLLTFAAALLLTFAAAESLSRLGHSACTCRLHPHSHPHPHRLPARPLTRAAGCTSSSSSLWSWASSSPCPTRSLPRASRAPGARSTASCPHTSAHAHAPRLAALSRNRSRFERLHHPQHEASEGAT